MGEIWKAVVGFEEHYEVSSLGRARSLPNIRPNPLTGGASQFPGKILTPVKSGGYYRIYMKGKRYALHRLVCETFHGPSPEGKPWALHWDDNPENNTPENLRWGSTEENEADKKRNGNNPEARKTHCPQGHEYTSENTRVGRSSGYRFCRECNRTAKREARSRGLKDEDTRHGTFNGYLGYGCRCVLCKEANREYAAIRALARTLRKV